MEGRPGVCRPGFIPLGQTKEVGTCVRFGWRKGLAAEGEVRDYASKIVAKDLRILSAGNERLARPRGSEGEKEQRGQAAFGRFFLRAEVKAARPNDRSQSAASVLEAIGAPWNALQRGVPHLAEFGEVEWNRFWPRTSSPAATRIRCPICPS